jgi:hypothetical protein
VDVNNERALFGPTQPVWDETQQGGITVEKGRLVLHYQQSDVTNVLFNIYRDGQLCAKAVRRTNWTDAASGDYHKQVHYYAVEAIDAVSGNASHLTPARCHLNDNQQQVIPAKDMKNRGGNLVADDHFENWGRRDDELSITNFTVARSGRYVIRARFSNGAGPVNTGITCAVKKLEICQAGSASAIASGYLIMPQSGDWHRWDMSSPVVANLAANEVYAIRVSEDDFSRNMSYLKKNERYTAWAGGGKSNYNFVNISGISLVNVAETAH